MFSHFNNYSTGNFPFLPFRRDLPSRYYLFSWTQYLLSNSSEKQLTLFLWLKEEHISCELTPLLWSESDPILGIVQGSETEFSCWKRTFQVLSISPEHSLLSIVQVPIGFPRLWNVPVCAQYPPSLQPTHANPTPPSSFANQLPAVLLKLILAEEESFPIKPSSKFLIWKSWNLRKESWQKNHLAGISKINSPVKVWK